MNSSILSWFLLKYFLSPNILINMTIRRLITATGTIALRKFKHLYATGKKDAFKS